MAKFPLFHRPAPNGPEKSPLPERWKRGRQRAAIICSAIIAVLLALFYVSNVRQWTSITGGVNDFDGWWLRARFALREKWFGPERDDRIVIVAIDDQSLDKWPEPSVLWGGHLADAVNQLNRSGAKVIALDWIQTFDADKQFHVRNDEKLGAALNAAKGIVLVKMVRPDGKFEYPVDTLRYALPGAFEDNGESSMGYADVASPSGIWDSIFPTVPGSKGQEVAFSARIAQKAAAIEPLGISVRPDGSMLVRFKGGTGYAQGGTFERVSLYDVATAKRPDPRWKDKIVLIGATYKGSNDTHFVPVLGRLEAGQEFSFRLMDVREIPGVEAQAHAVATILDDAAIDESLPLGVVLLAGLLGAVGIGAYTIWNWGRAAFAMAVVVLGWTVFSFIVFCSDNFALPVVVPLLTLLLGAGMMGGYRAFSEERERAQVMDTWGKHQDPRLIQHLLENPGLRSGEGQERQVTVLFADLKNFTKTVEHLPPTPALEALNRYLALISQSIREHGGYLDKYLGDGLMAEWGALDEEGNHADAALSACLDIQKRLEELCRRLEGTGAVVFETRLTLHSGSVFVGPIGADERQEYTIIGDTVNVTSRMQETAKQLNVDFLISETTQGLLSQALELGQKAEVEIRGRQRPLIVYEVLGEAINSPAEVKATGRGTDNGKDSGLSVETAAIETV